MSKRHKRPDPFGRDDPQPKPTESWFQATRTDLAQQHRRILRKAVRHVLYLFAIPLMIAFLGHHLMSLGIDPWALVAVPGILIVGSGTLYYLGYFPGRLLKNYIDDEHELFQDLRDALNDRVGEGQAGSPPLANIIAGLTADMEDCRYRIRTLEDFGLSTFALGFALSALVSLLILVGSLAGAMTGVFEGAGQTAGALETLSGLIGPSASIFLLSWLPGSLFFWWLYAKLQKRYRLKSREAFDPHNKIELVMQRLFKQIKALLTR